MKTVKFRGVKVTDGEYVYGDLSHDRGHISINGKRVKPEPIDQLVGYDKDGEEIYEGDRAFNHFGEKFIPKIEAVYYSNIHFFNTDLGVKTGLKLKK
mgnify:CR=1 FL=1